MDWRPGGMSSDVEDRRGESGGGGFGFGGIGGGGLGIGGLVIVLVISLLTGRNYIGQILGGGGGTQTQQTRQSSEPIQETPEEKRSAQLISFVLDDAQKTWTEIFQKQGAQYERAKLVLFRDATYSGCGNAESSTGPFYCPADQKVYIDLSFWDELRKFGGGSSDFAQGYVVAHEIGHHVQDVLGIEAKVRQAMQRNRGARNQLSVAMELQADCFAGVWAHSTEQRNIVNQDDIEGGLKAAAAVGDDHLQKMAGKAVSPESFTHGSSAQRQQWFTKGLQGGTIQSCNAFGSNAGGGDSDF